MDGKFLGLFIMVLFGALPCIVLGYLIAVKQKHGLIAGWDESKISNPTAFGKWVGFSVLALGVCIGLIGVVWFFGLLNEIHMTIALALVSIIPIPCLIIATKRYKQHGS
jgi:hypothetical protein